MQKEAGFLKRADLDATAESMIEIPVYHGSSKIMDIPDIQFPGPREDCDFGRGFYVTQHKITAEEWVLKEETPVINKYTL